MADPRGFLVRRLSRLGPERLGRIAATPVTRPALRWIAGGPITVPTGVGQGMRMDMSGLPVAHAQLGDIAYGLLEQPVQEALRRHVEPDAVFYDVGANVGFFTVLGARLAPRGAVHAFEPAPDSAAAIRASVALNGLGNVTVHEQAVGAAAGTGRLQVVGDRSWSKLVETGAHPGTERVIDVPVVAIDELQLPPPTIVKIDVEGYELQVLAGMRRTLAEHAPAVICELHGTHAEFATLMHDAGYRLVNLEGAGPVAAAGDHSRVLALPSSHYGD